MCTILLLLALVILWSIGPTAWQFALAGDGFPFGWPYAEDNPLPDASAKGEASVPKQPKQKEVKLPPVPQAQPLPAPAPPPPPPTQDMSEVDQAGDDQKRKAARQNGVSKTLLAGETGGYSSGDGSTGSSGKKTLLG